MVHLQENVRRFCSTKTFFLFIFFFSFTLKNDSTVYQIGICQDLAIGNKTNSGVVQEENHKSFVLGRIDRVRLFEGGRRRRKRKRKERR